MKVPINIQLVRNGLVILEDCENGTRMEHIVSASDAKPVTQVGHAVLYIMLQKKLKDIVTSAYGNVYMYLPFFPLCRAIINHMMGCKLHIYS
jgi:hypothetical protein